MLLVQADDPAGCVHDEILAVGVEIPQQPVGDVLPLDLRGDVGAQIGRRALLPCLEVDAPGGGVDLFLECAEFAAQVAGADLDGAVRVNDVLHLVARLLDVGTVFRRGASLGLRRLKIPFLSVGVDPAFHLAGVADVQVFVVRHAGRHGDVGRDHGLRRPSGRRGGVLRCGGCTRTRPRLEAALRRLRALDGLENGRDGFLEMGGAPAARVKRRDHRLPCVEGVIRRLVDGDLFALHGRAYRADVVVRCGIDDQVAVAHVPGGLGLPDIFGIPEIVREGGLGRGDGEGPVAMLPGGVLHGRVLGLLLRGGLLHGGVVRQEVVPDGGVILQIRRCLLLRQAHQGADGAGQFVNGVLPGRAGADQRLDGRPAVVTDGGDEFRAVGADPGRHPGAHGVEYPPAGCRGRDGRGAGRCGLLPKRGKVDGDEIGVVLLPCLEGSFVHVPVFDGLPQLLVCDGVLLICPHAGQPVHGGGGVGVEVVV